MRLNPKHAVTDEAFVRQLIADNPWATIISQSENGPVASHYPVLIDSESEQLALVTHVGKPDDQVHSFGDDPVLVIIAGPHGYISPSWYSDKPLKAPTWNFTVAHCYGVPQILSLEGNIAVLERLVAHFEQHVEHPAYLQPEVAAKLGPHTVGLRIPIDRFICKRKMSQDKDPESQQNVLAQLRGDGYYADPVLADLMDAALSDQRQ